MNIRALSSLLIRNLEIRILVSSLFWLSGQGVSAEPDVTVRTVDGREESGTLTAMDESGLVLKTGSERRIALADLVELECVGSDVDGSGPSARLFLTTGDRLAVDVVRLEDDALVCRWREFEELEFQVPLESVAGLTLNEIADGRAQRSLERQLEQREFRTDVLFLTNGDRLAGIFDGLDQNSCHCETAAGTFEVNRSRVRAVGFNAALLAPVERPALELVLNLTDGSWLTCGAVEWSGGQRLDAVTTAGVEVPIPVGKIRSILCYGPRVTPLSELEPLEVVMTPYLTRETPMQRDRSAWGGALTIHGEPFARGLGMFSRTSATYPLAGAYATFHAVVGIDDAAGGDGSVTFAVDVDGERVFESGIVTGRGEPLPIGPIDVRNAESMTLIVDYGTRGDIGDLADWCNPVLIR